MKPEAHGGDRLRMAALAGRAPDSLLDFSVNVRPEGAPEFLRLALCRALDHISAYPSPHAEEAMEAAARVYGLPADCFVFGNGTNELIHLLARVLKEDGTPCAAVIEPAFSEYALACGLAGLEVRHPDCGVRRDGDSDEDMLRQMLSLLADIPARAAVWLANPGNPSGSFLPPASCRRLLEARPDLLWIIDEAFAAYAGPDDISSLITQLPDNAVLLRSLTKFHAVPGVRLGYMVTRAERARRWRRQLPAWSVNAFALAAAQAVLADTSDFADRTRDENRRRREHLCACLRDVPGITVFPSLANYVLFRCEQAPADLYARLLREYGIAVRDCSNYRGMKDGALCECIRRKMFELLSEDCPDRVTDKKTFTKGDLDALSEGDRDAYRNAYNLLKALASKFPAQKTSIFGISGPVGSGKSYAATVFANMVMDKGHTALIYPASMMNRLFLSSHLAPIERKREILMPLEECDLLVIDDLGTETEYNNVSLPYLYELIAVRAGKLTMITTNLDESGVLSRYGDRIFSRLFDRAAAKWIALNGPDLRLRDKPRQ